MQVDERTQGQPQVHTHEALLRVGDVEHALHTEEIHSPGREELVHPLRAPGRKRAVVSARVSQRVVSRVGCVSQRKT